MFTITVTKYNTEEGITNMIYLDVDEYEITDDYLMLERKSINSIVYIQKDQVLEFEVNWYI